MLLNSLIFHPSFTVDFNRDIFVVPYLNHPITWYGFLFAFGFFVAYYVVRYIFRVHFSYEMKEEKAKEASLLMADRMALFAVIGTVVGARLGHVFFYEWSYYRHHLDQLLKIWEGGLASHGGAVGILIGLIVLYFWSKRKYPSITFLVLLDTISIPTAFVGGCIRIGNFINQEVLGTPTNMPWGVLFLLPAQRVEPVPLHPVQLYESFSYFLIFAFLFYLWKKRGKKVGEGVISAYFFLLIFGARFIIEFFKLPQSDLIDEKVITMGQLLSIPFILAGALYLFYYYWKNGTCKCSLKKKTKY